jgi:primosomal protein N'
MNIITVIPLTRSKVGPELSYFTASEVPLGAIVSVPLRSKSIHAIVVKSEPAQDQKMGLKNSPFEIRKLGKVRAAVFFPESFIEAAKTLADYYATHIGTVIDAMVADAILENANKISPPLPPQAALTMSDGKKRDMPRTRAESDRVFVIQADDGDRMSAWRSLIRQEFARKRSVSIYAPTIEDCDAIHAALAKGIEGYIFKLNGSITKKKVADTWKTISETEHPVVTISTGSFSVLPRGDIETMIIERENGRGWVSPRAPYLDIRHALETIARHRRQTVFIADSLLRTETLYRMDRHEIEHGSPFKWRSVSTARDNLVDMRKEAQSAERARASVNPPDAALSANGGSTADQSQASAFRTLSPELEALIRTNHEESTHLFILAMRRGSASITVCEDCESVVLCRNCSAPVVLHAKTAADGTNLNYFMCHKCGERRSADETCSSCGSWRLTPLGVGVDRVYEEIRACFPDIDIYRIDSDSTSTDKQISETLEKFRTRPGSIILGTELAMLRFVDRIEHIAIASLDSLFALPDFRIEERIMYTLIRLRAQAVRTFLVQTRKSEEKVFEYGLKGNLSDFYRATIAERKQFSYPPYSILVKITIEGKKDVIAKAMEQVQKSLEPRQLEIFPAFTSTARGNAAIHGLLTIESHVWPDPDLIAKLRALPPDVSVKVNPESLL